jgi:hypothetical protein
VRELRLPPRVLALLVIGLLVRLAWVVAHPVEPISDFAHYNQLASTFADHWVYGGSPATPMAYWPPAWPVMLGLLYAIAGTHPQAGAVLGVVLEWAAIVVAAAAAVRLLRPRFAEAAVAVMCFYPGAISFAPVLGTEHLTAVLFTSLVVVMAFSRPSARSALACGLLVGGLCLARGDYGVPSLLLVTAWLLRGVPARRLVPVAAVAAAGALAVTGPWIARNAVRFGEFIPTSTNGGINFYLGTLADGYTVPAFVRRFHVSDPHHPRAHENEYYRRGLDNVSDHPLRWLHHDVNRLYLSLGRESLLLQWGEIDDPFLRFAASVYWLAILAFGILGLGVIAGERARLPSAWLVIAGSLVVVILLKLAYLDAARSRLPLTYLLVAVAGLGAQWLSDAFGGRAASARSGRGPRSRPAS